MMHWIEQYISALPADHKQVIEVVGLEKYLELYEAFRGDTILFGRKAHNKALKLYLKDHIEDTTEEVSITTGARPFTIDNFRRILGLPRWTKRARTLSQNRHIDDYILNHPYEYTGIIAQALGADKTLVSKRRTRLVGLGLVPRVQ